MFNSFLYVYQRVNHQNLRTTHIFPWLFPNGPGIAWTPGAAIRLTWRPIRPPCRGRSPAWTPGTPSYPRRLFFFSFFGDQLVDIPFWMVLSNFEYTLLSINWLVTLVMMIYNEFLYQKIMIKGTIPSILSHLEACWGHPRVIHRVALQLAAPSGCHRVGGSRLRILLGLGVNK